MTECTIQCDLVPRKPFFLVLNITITSYDQEPIHVKFLQMHIALRWPRAQDSHQMGV